MVIQAIQNCLHRFPELDRVQPIDERKYSALKAMQAEPYLSTEKGLQFSPLGQLISGTIHRMSVMERNEVFTFISALYASFQDHSPDIEAIINKVPATLAGMAHEQEIEPDALIQDLFEHFEATRRALSEQIRFRESLPLAEDMLYIIFMPAGD